MFARQMSQGQLRTVIIEVSPRYMTRKFGQSGHKFQSLFEVGQMSPGQMSPGQMLPAQMMSGQMSPLKLSPDTDTPTDIPLKFA